jgi:hypothetical protein
MNLMARVINRLGFRWGIRPFPTTTDSTLATAGGAHPDVFDAIHAANYWGSPESLSGGGSTLGRTSDYAASLERFLVDRSIRSMFDAPCGDLNWMPGIVDATGIAYLGGDVSELALGAARRRRPDLDVRLFDICRDDFPAAELWHCRDCLFHLSFDDGLAALRNFARSSIAHALITTNPTKLYRNPDIKTGGHRFLDLQRAPYRLPPPRARLRDYPVGHEFPRYVGFWSREEIAAAVL